MQSVQARRYCTTPSLHSTLALVSSAMCPCSYASLFCTGPHSLYEIVSGGCCLLHLLLAIQTNIQNGSLCCVTSKLFSLFCSTQGRCKMVCVHLAAKQKVLAPCHCSQGPDNCHSPSLFAKDVRQVLFQGGFTLVFRRLRGHCLVFCCFGLCVESFSSCQH